MVRLLPGLFILLFAPFAFAGTAPIFSTEEGAIRGYDPVAYFTLGKPVRGSDEFTTEWKGATFKFVSAENLALFKAEPNAYAPQYGGYCAYAVSKGATAGTVPDAWSIVDGKLYLNYSANVHKRWKKNIPGYIKAADRNWPTVLE